MATPPKRATLIILSRYRAAAVDFLRLAQLNLVRDKSLIIVAFIYPKGVFIPLIVPLAGNIDEALHAVSRKAREVEADAVTLLADGYMKDGLTEQQANKFKRGGMKESAGVSEAILVEVFEREKPVWIIKMPYTRQVVNGKEHIEFDSQHPVQHRNERTLHEIPQWWKED